MQNWPNNLGIDCGEDLEISFMWIGLIQAKDYKNEKFYCWKNEKFGFEEKQDLSKLSDDEKENLSKKIIEEIYFTSVAQLDRASAF